MGVYLTHRGCLVRKWRRGLWLCGRQHWSTALLHITAPELELLMICRVGWVLFCYSFLFFFGHLKTFYHFCLEYIIMKWDISMCFNIECIYLALWQIKCCSFACKRWREINLDRYISILRRNIEYIPSEYCHQKQQANMETFTIHDMLINSTDIYQILCGLGIGNLSECKNDNNATSEPKGKDNLTFYCI